ncbi:MAG: polyphosphate polymerase domain-containing protein [Verrucomicrobiota bacterium]
MSLLKSVSTETANPATLRSPRKRTQLAQTDEKPAETDEKHADYNRQLRRYETKYVIPAEMVAEIRKEIRPFCEPDPNCTGDPPTYINTTLQLDSPGLSLHYAKLWDFVDRFKLRVRTYGDPVGECPVFLEVKAKDRNMIYKYRSQIPFAQWGEHLFQDRVIKGIQFKKAKEANNFYQFIRLVKQIGARPLMLIRYQRESYFGKVEDYARVTFDSRLEFQQTYAWNSWGSDGVWRALDNPMMQTRRHDKELDFSGVVLELKALNHVPRWMMDLVTKFDLWRVGHCKYSNAIWAESMFHATPWTPEYEIDLLRYL